MLIAVGPEVAAMMLRMPQRRKHPSPRMMLALASFCVVILNVLIQQKHLYTLSTTKLPDERTEQPPDGMTPAAHIDATFTGSYWQKDIENGLIGYFLFDRNEFRTKKSLKELIQGSNNLLLELNDHQYKLLDDETIDPIIEEQRCKRYGFDYNNRTTRRRIFYGATIADDSLYLQQTISTEAYNLFHTVSFVESNSTHMRTKRDLRFPPGANSKRLLQSMFGPNTRVYVDYFIDAQNKSVPEGNSGFHWQHMQRQGMLERWKLNGMQPNDIGFLGDADELFSRDFFRAVQICTIPELEPGQQTCHRPKLMGTGLIFEGSPECMVETVRLWHPDVLLGECIDLIGDSKLHKPPDRTWMKQYSFRVNDHGYSHNYTGYFLKNNDTSLYPLWNGADIRRSGGGRQVPLDQNQISHTAYHWHNFFESTEEIRHKYTTYGEPNEKAKSKPLAMIHDDLSVSVTCVHGWQNKGERKWAQEKYDAIVGPRPIFFENEDIRKVRHEQLKNLVLEDEKQFGLVNSSCSSVTCEEVKS